MLISRKELPIHTSNLPDRLPLPTKPDFEAHEDITIDIGSEPRRRQEIYTSHKWGGNENVVNNLFLDQVGISPFGATASNIHTTVQVLLELQSIESNEQRRICLRTEEGSDLNGTLSLRPPTVVTSQLYPPWPSLGPSPPLDKNHGTPKFLSLMRWWCTERTMTW